MILDEAAMAAAIDEVSDSPGAVGFEQWSAKLAPKGSHLHFEYESLHLDRFAGPRRLHALTAS